MIRLLANDGHIKRLSLEEYLEKLQNTCSCLAQDGRLCICSAANREDISSHLARLEKDGFSRARIVDKTLYKKELALLAKKRPIMLRKKREVDLPF